MANCEIMASQSLEIFVKFEEIMHIKKNILLCKKKNIKYRKSDYAYQVVNELDGFYFKRIHNFLIY